MVIYYFRQPDIKKEEYFMYSNTSLTRVGEVMHTKMYTSWKEAARAVKYLNNSK